MDDKNQKLSCAKCDNPGHGTDLKITRCCGEAACRHCLNEKIEKEGARCPFCKTLLQVPPYNYGRSTDERFWEEHPNKAQAGYWDVFFQVATVGGNAMFGVIVQADTEQKAHEIFHDASQKPGVIWEKASLLSWNDRLSEAEIMKKFRKKHTNVQMIKIKSRSESNRIWWEPEKVLSKADS